MPLSERRRYLNRTQKRKYKHGENWRQIVVDCGALCVNCFSLESLEFHEPFGENHNSNPKFQSRVLLCSKCHSKEHGEMFARRFVHKSHLLEDVAFEMEQCGGYNKWIKKYNLIDRFGELLIQKRMAVQV